jgi:hypothetical protein
MKFDTLILDGLILDALAHLTFSYGYGARNTKMARYPRAILSKS